MTSLKQMKRNLKKSKKNMVKKTKKGGARPRTKPQKHIKSSNKGTKKVALAALAGLAALGLGYGVHKHQQNKKKSAKDEKTNTKLAQILEEASENVRTDSVLNFFVDNNDANDRDDEDKYKKLFSKISNTKKKNE